MYDDTTTTTQELESAVSAPAAESVDPSDGATSSDLTAAESSQANADDKPASDDFAAALENFTTETEDAVSDDNVLKGTVLKLSLIHI